jgi:UPF0716 family protein affecting phage T7 exclusion
MGATRKAGYILSILVILMGLATDAVWGLLLITLPAMFILVILIRRTVQEKHRRFYQIDYRGNRIEISKEDFKRLKDSPY